MIWLWLALTTLAACFGLVLLAGAPYVPTKTAELQAGLRAITSRHGKSNGLFVDLGCGDGKVLLAAAQAGWEVVGYELNPLLWAVARWRLRHYQAHVYLRNFWRADLRSADIVYVFLIGHFMRRLEHKAATELHPGSWLISNSFELPHHRAHKQIGPLWLYKF